MIKQPLLVLDIDGTVRHGFDELGRFVNSPDDVVVFPEAVERMREWKAAGGFIVGVSNQAGVGLGYMTAAACAATMKRTNELTGWLFDDIVWCAHRPSDNCLCRKPEIGLLHTCFVVLNRRGLEVSSDILMVGDREEDQKFAERAMIRFQWADAWRKGEQA